MLPDPPPGFEPITPPFDAVMAGFSPIHVLREGDHVSIGFRVGPQHCNMRNHCHGGVWAYMADVQLGVNVGTMTGQSGPTVSLSLDYFGAAAIGQWVQGQTRLLRKTPNLAFLDATFTVDGELAVRANAIFRLKLPPEREFRPAG